MLCRYSNWSRTICATAGALSAAGGYLVSYYWYSYSAFSWQFNCLNLAGNMISGAILGGLAARYLANKMALAGVLNQYRISHDSQVS